MSSTDALIASLKLQIEKLRHELYGQRSERTARLLDQMEIELEELKASATEDEFKAEMAAKEAGSEVKSAQPQEAIKETLPRASAARTGGHSRPDILRRRSSPSMPPSPKRWTIC